MQCFVLRLRAAWLVRPERLDQSQQDLANKRILNEKTTNRAVKNTIERELVLIERPAIKSLLRKNIQKKSEKEIINLIKCFRPWALALVTILNPPILPAGFSRGILITI
ncbi:hypothetical protein BpHYR1_023134 [Brachionus plicatilis]|uniref:Uncharacterized protein n=1 Tax=Brachionus plicatilis TaxID=10195 RepID=A0A3M7QHM1_BRAPC|nr:hypothetical protein BpHYR1_023134 [Brachionus plicatilis]